MGAVELPDEEVASAVEEWADSNLDDRIETWMEGNSSTDVERAIRELLSDFTPGWGRVPYGTRVRGCCERHLGSAWRTGTPACQRCDCPLGDRRGETPVRQSRVPDVPNVYALARGDRVMALPGECA